MMLRVSILVCTFISLHVYASQCSANDILDAENVYKYQAIRSYTGFRKDELFGGKCGSFDLPSLTDHDI